MLERLVSEAEKAPPIKVVARSLVETWESINKTDYTIEDIEKLCEVVWSSRYILAIGYGGRLSLVGEAQYLPSVQLNELETMTYKLRHHHGSMDEDFV